MNRLPKITLLITILLAFFSITAEGARLRRQTKEYHEYFSNGQLKKYTRVKTAQTVGFEFDNNYKRTSVWEVEYFESGNTRSTFKKVTKIGTSGKSCYELKTVTKTYDDKGVLRKKEINHCDQGKTLIRFYDEAGKLTFTKIVYDVS